MTHGCDRGKVLIFYSIAVLTREKQICSKQSICGGDHEPLQLLIESKAWAVEGRRHLAGEAAQAGTVSARDPRITLSTCKQLVPVNYLSLQSCICLLSIIYSLHLSKSYGCL